MKRSIAAVVGLALTIGFASCSSEKHSETKAPELVRDVALYQAVSATVPDAFVAIGTVRAAESAQLAAQMMGTVVSVNVREGDAVKRGQVLATIDPSQAQAGLERAQAALNAAQNEVVAAQTQRSLAETTLKRYETLYQRKSVSPQEFDEVRARFDGAAARADSARSAEAQAKAAVAQAQTAFGYTKIRAPFDGVVTERRVDPGALAGPGMPLISVETTGRYRLEATVDERSLRFVRERATVPVRLDAYPDEAFYGKVAQIVPAADPNSRSFMVKVELEKSSAVRSGLFGRAEFTRGERNTLVVPRTAVVDRGSLKAVYVVGQDKVAALRYVTLGSAVAERVEVLSGLSANESVVLAPGEQELGGRKVEVQ